MFEEPNQVEEDLFSDIEETDSSDETVETEVNDAETHENSAQNEVKEIKDEPFLNITYNKEEIALNREEAIELAQKGKNYDKVNEKYQSLNSNLERLAKLNGKTVDEYLNTLEEAQKNLEISREMKSLREQYPRADEEVLKELATRRVDSHNIERQNTEIKEKSVAEDATLKEIERQVKVFQSRYPNLKPDGLDNQVYSLMKNDGYTLLEAYNIYKEGKEAEIKTANESKEKTAKLNESNRSKSLGNTSNVDSVAIDDFMTGFDS